MTTELHVKAGDVIAKREESGQWSVRKVLLVDDWPDSSQAAHCRFYDKVATRPTLADVRKLGVRVGHAPIDAASYRTGWELIGNEPVARDEFEGFIVYLKLTDFPRYLEFTGQDVDKVIEAANAHYQRALVLDDQKKRAAAIDEYGKAVELFPLFYEALDNRGLLYMELARWREALGDFEASLQVEPNGFHAYFSRAECLLRLGEFSQAEKLFSDGMVKFPEQAALLTKFRDYARNKNKNF